MPLLVDVIQVQMDLEINRACMRQLASGVAYLHERGVTHNDIKPANIMMSYSGVPVLIDFGFAHSFDLNQKDAFWTQASWATAEVSYSKLDIRHGSKLTSSTSSPDALPASGTTSARPTSGRSASPFSSCSPRARRSSLPRTTSARPRKSTRRTLRGPSGASGSATGTFLLVSCHACPWSPCEAELTGRP